MKIVFTNGCFDVLHVGHIRLLQYSRSLGDMLIVGVNDDTSVRRLKGNTRPINPINERMEMLIALRCVTHVFSFGEDTPQRLIHSIKPNVFVVGDEPHKRNIPEFKLVNSLGGVVVKFPMVDGRSTTETLRQK